MQFSEPLPTDVRTDFRCHSSGEQQQPCWNHQPLTRLLPVDDLSQSSSFASASDKSLADELFDLDALLDLPLFDPTFPPAPPSGTGNAPLQLPPPTCTGEQPPCPFVSAMPPCATHGQGVHQPFYGPGDPPLPVLPHQASNLHLPTHSTLPLDVLTYFDDPINATLINAQLSKPRPKKIHQPVHGHHRPRPPATAIPPARPITKPSRKKLRPKDTINTLQQHLEGVASKLQDLALHNGHLHRRRKVLGLFMQELAHIETVAAEISIAREHHRLDPSRPLQGAAALQACTPQQFGDAYRNLVALMQQLIVAAEASDAPGGASRAQEARLHEAVQKFLDDSAYALYGRLDFIGGVMAQQLQLFAGVVSEEEHWTNVVTSMNLTDEQVEDLLVAREVFLQYADKEHRESDTAVAALRQRAQQAAATSGAGDTLQDADQIARLAATVQKIYTLNICFVFLWFKHILTPLQAARSIVQAYPLSMNGMILCNTLHALRGQAPGLLGPQPSPMAMVRTAAVVLSMASGPPPSGPLPASSCATTPNSSDAAAAPRSRT